MDVRYVRSLPCTIQEIKGYFYDHNDDFELEELQDQEAVYQSLKRSTKNDGAESSHGNQSQHDSKLDQSSSSKGIGFSSESMNKELQLELDEAMARALQDAEDQFAVTSLDDTGPGSSEMNHQPDSSSTGPIQRISSELVVREDGIDPDNMTYEELQSLGEAIGSESRGLTDDLISYLPTSKYRTGFFSRKDKHECIICCMTYKNRDVLIMLPCKHNYHSKCISKWLKINKACPVCNVEVFGS